MNENKKLSWNYDKFNKKNKVKKDISSSVFKKSSNLKMKREEILLKFENFIKKFNLSYKCIISAIHKSQKLYCHFKSKKRDRIKKFIVISHKLNRISKILSKKKNFFNIKNHRKEKLLKSKKKSKSVHSSMSIITKNDYTRKKIQEQLDLLRNSNKSLERQKNNGKYVDETLSNDINNSIIVPNCENFQSPLIIQDNRDQNLPIVVDVVGNFQEHFLIEDKVNKNNDFSFNHCIINDVNMHLSEFNFPSNENQEPILDNTLQKQNSDCITFNVENPKNILLSNKNVNGYISDESIIKLPTKTLDIKKIKGWRSKKFLSQIQTCNNVLLNENDIKKENEITFIEEPLNFPDNDINNVNKNNKSNKEENKIELENKAAFESTFLDQFLTNAKLNISYQVPKLIAEDSISNPIDEHVPSFQTNKVVKEHTTTKHSKKIDNSIKVKPKTLAEKRKLLEVNRQKNILHEIEINENTLLKQLHRISKKQKNESCMSIRKLLLKQNIPITRELWMATVKCKKIGTLLQKISFGDEEIYIAGSYIKDKNIFNSEDEKKVKIEVNEKKTSKSENLHSSCIVDSKELITNSKSQFFKHSTYRPGPLSRKPDLVNEKFVDSTVVVRKMPQLFLEVYPEIGKPMHPRAEYYLKLYRENESIISSDWALFAVSVLKHKNSHTINSNNSFIFPIDYSNNQCKILMKEPVVDKLKMTCKVEGEPVVLNEVKQIMSDILDYLETPKIDNSVLEYCPHSLEFDKQESTQNLNQLKSKDDTHTVIRTPKGKIAKSKVMSELKRLSVQLIEVNIDQKKLKVCEKPYCKLGCICFDPSTEWPKHCGRESCMFECSCNIKFDVDLKPHHYVSLPEGVDLLSASTMGQLQNQAKRHLAKEERKFTQTVIKANNQTIVVGEGSRERKKRPTKTPQKYNDYISVGDDLRQIATTPDSSVKQNIQSSIPVRKSIRIWNKNSKEDLIQQKQEIVNHKCVVFVDKIQGLENVLPWCMVHNLYKCFCGGNVLEDALTSIDIKKNIKEDENDSDSYIFYSSRRAHQNQSNTSDHRSKLCSRIYGVSSFYITRNKSAYYKSRIAKIKELEENSNNPQHSVLKSILLTKEDTIEVDPGNAIKSTNINKKTLNNHNDITDTKSINRKTDSESEWLQLTPESNNWLPDLGLPRPNMQSELRNIFRDFSKKHIFRVMCWAKLSIHFKQNTLHFWYNPSSIGAKLVITKHLNEKPFKYLLLKDFFQGDHSDVPEIVKGLLNDTLPGKATVDKDTYAILVYNGKYWEIRGTVISKNEKFVVPEEKNNLDSKDTVVNNKEDIDESNKAREEYNRMCELRTQKLNQLLFDLKFKKSSKTDSEIINKEIKNKNPSPKKSNQTSEIKNKESDTCISTCDGEESNNLNSEDQQIMQSQYFIRTKKLSELTDVSFETKEVPLTIAKPILSKDMLFSKSIQVPLPVSRRDCRWFMLILQEDFVMLSIKGSTAYIKYSKLKRAASVATHFAKTLRVLIPRESQTQDKRDPLFGIYAVPGLLEKVFFGPYNLDEDHGILKYRYLNGQLVTTQFMEKLCAPHQKSKGIWLYTQAEQKNKIQNSPMTTNISYVDLTYEDSILNNNSQDTNSDIECSTRTPINNNEIQSTSLNKESNISNLIKDMRKTNKRKNLGSPKTSDEVFELCSEASAKNKTKCSESKTNDNIDNDMPELIEEGTKPYIRVSKEELVMPVLEPVVSAVRKVEKKSDKNVLKKRLKEVNSKLVNSTTKLESKVSTLTNPKITCAEKTHQQYPQNEVVNKIDKINKVDIIPVNSKILEKNTENANCTETQQLQKVSHNKIEILSDEILPKLQFPKNVIKSPETEVWLISDPPKFGYISLKLIENEGYVLHLPLSTKRKYFSSMKETLNWIDELLRKCLYFVPKNFQIRMFLIKDKKNLRNINPLQKNHLLGYHMICAKGLFDLTTLTENEINSFGLRFPDKRKLLMKQKQVINTKLTYELATTFLLDNMHNYSESEIIEMACDEIKSVKKKNIKLKMIKRDLAIHHNDLVDKLRTLRYQLRKNQECDKNKCLTDVNQKKIDSKILDNFDKNSLNLLSQSSINVTSETTKIKSLNTSKSNLKRPHSEINDDEDCCIIIDSDDERIEESITLNNVTITSQSNNQEKKVVDKISIQNNTLMHKKILLQGGSTFKIKEGKLIYPIVKSKEITVNKISDSQKGAQNESNNKCENSLKKSNPQNQLNILKTESVKRVMEKHQSNNKNSIEIEKSILSALPISKPPVSLQSVVTAKSSSPHSLYVPFVLQNGAQVLIPIESKGQFKNDSKNISIPDKKNSCVINKSNNPKKYLICTKSVSKPVPAKLNEKQLNSNTKMIKTSPTSTSTQLANNGTSILKSNFPEVIEID